MLDGLGLQSHDSRPADGSGREVPCRDDEQQPIPSRPRLDSKNMSAASATLITGAPGSKRESAFRKASEISSTEQWGKLLINCVSHGRRIAGSGSWVAELKGTFIAGG